MKMVSVSAIRKNGFCVLKKFGAARAFVFGSVARGEAQKNSDIDLLVEFKKTPTLLTVVALERELGKALKREVDILTPGQITDRLRRLITPDLKRVL